MRIDDVCESVDGTAWSQTTNTSRDPRVTNFATLLAVSNAAGDDGQNPPFHVDVAALLFGDLHGGSHLGARAFHFPTYVQMSIWRACGITLCTTPIVMGIPWLLNHPWIESTLETDAGGTFLLIESVWFDLLSLCEAFSFGGTVSGSEESGEWESQAC